MRTFLLFCLLYFLGFSEASCGAAGPTVVTKTFAPGDFVAVQETSNGRTPIVINFYEPLATEIVVEFSYDGYLPDVDGVIFTRPSGGGGDILVIAGIVPG